MAKFEPELHCFHASNGTRGDKHGKFKCTTAGDCGDFKSVKVSQGEILKCGSFFIDVRIFKYILVYIHL